MARRVTELKTVAIDNVEAPEPAAGEVQRGVGAESSHAESRCCGSW
jgi:hypothetical protein